VEQHCPKLCCPLAATKKRAKSFQKDAILVTTLGYVWTGLDSVTFYNRFQLLCSKYFKLIFHIFCDVYLRHSTRALQKNVAIFGASLLLFDKSELDLNK